MNKKAKEDIESLTQRAQEAAQELIEVPKGYLEDIINRCQLMEECGTCALSKICGELQDLVTSDTCLICGDSGTHYHLTDTPGWKVCDNCQTMIDRRLALSASWMDRVRLRYYSIVSQRLINQAVGVGCAAVEVRLDFSAPFEEVFNNLKEEALKGRL